jgi:hypothetical protein
LARIGGWEGGIEERREGSGIVGPSGTEASVTCGWKWGYEKGEEDMGGQMQIIRDREADWEVVGMSHRERPVVDS